MIFPQLVSVIAQLYPHVVDLREEVSKAMADGGISATEARDLGFAFSDELSITIKIRGRDVVKRQAQREFFGAAGRVIRQIALALGEG